MGRTKIENLNATNATLVMGASLPQTPYAYYDSSALDPEPDTWKGGELFYLTTENRLNIQTATSGTTPTWKRLLEQFVTP